MARRKLQIENQHIEILRGLKYEYRADMNLAIHGIEANVGLAPDDTFLSDAHPDLKADFILANPPFNASDGSGALLRGDTRFVFGDPPVDNANYGWIQQFIHHLAYPNGRGGAGDIHRNPAFRVSYERRSKPYLDPGPSPQPERSGRCDTSSQSLSGRAGDLLHSCPLR